MNAADNTGQTALHWSAVRGHIPVAELLLKEGARVDAADFYGYQVCFHAALLYFGIKCHHLLQLFSAVSLCKIYEHALFCGGVSSYKLISCSVTVKIELSSPYSYIYVLSFLFFLVSGKPCI